MVSNIANKRLEENSVAMKQGIESPLDGFCELLTNTLFYNKGERDVVILHHTFGIKEKDGKKVSCKLISRKP